ncbi:MAG: glucose 1-dehydrogenase [Pseudomonadota bacterium]
MTEKSKLPQTPSFRLDGRKALVTGAGRGIGLAASAALAEAGADVVLVARSADEIEAAADAIRQAGGSASAVTLDVTDTDAVRRLFDENGPFHVVVSNAGTNRPKFAIDVTEDDFDTIMDLNLRAAYFLAQTASKSMIDAGVKGSIITVSSQMGTVGGERRSVYCASKHALEGMTKSMAWELGPHDIRINTLCPTFIETPLTRPFFEDEAFRQSVLSKIALGRVGQVEDLMGAIVFLASDASAMVTGSALLVDGGWTAI